MDWLLLTVWWTIWNHKISVITPVQPWFLLYASPVSMTSLTEILKYVQLQKWAKKPAVRHLQEQIPEPEISVQVPVQLWENFTVWNNPWSQVLVLPLYLWKISRWLQLSLSMHWEISSVHKMVRKLQGWKHLTEAGFWTVSTNYTALWHLMTSLPAIPPSEL